MPIQPQLEFSFGSRQAAGNARISLTGNIYCLGKRLKKRLDDVMRLVAVEQFQVQVAASLIGEPLKEFAGQSKPEDTRHVLPFFSAGKPFMGELVHPPPNQVRPAAEINNASSQALVHWHIGLAGKGIARIETRSVTPNALLIAQRLGKSLTEREAAIFNGMMGINLQIAIAAQLQIQNGMFGKQIEHVIEERNTGVDG